MRLVIGSYRFLMVVGLLASSLQAMTYNCTAVDAPAGSPTGINNDGVIVGNAAGGHGFIRDAAGNVTLVDYPGSNSNTQFFAINNNGIVTGLWGNKFDMPGTFAFFTWDSKHGTFTPIVFPAPWNQSSNVKTLYGINDAGAMAFSNEGVGALSFFILNPDGTATTVPAGTRATSPAALNNARELIENGAEMPQPLTAYLVKPDNSTTLINWPYPGNFGSTAYGLNNNGMIAGYVGLYHSAPNTPPSAGFTMDAAGIFSEVVCPNGFLALDLEPRAINDNGVIAGGGFIATPIPGSAQYNSTATSFDFGTVTSGIQAPSKSFTISNTGNARLDIGGIRMQGYPCCSAPDYNVSGCVSQGTTVTSLDPGASCVVTVAPKQTISHTGTIADTVVIDDSAPGAPHTVTVTMNAVSNGYPPFPPTCEAVGPYPGAPRHVNLLVYDSGLQSIDILDSVNANISIPSFAPGDMSVQTVTVTEIDPSQNTKADIKATGLSGYSSTCGTTIYGAAGVWKGLGGSVVGKPSVGLNFDGRLEVFVRNSDNSVWHKAQTSPGGTDWSDWQSFGGIINSDPVVGQNEDGRLEVFASGTDGALWHIAQTSPGGSTWTPWTSLGGAVSGNPAVLLDGAFLLEVFARGPDGALWNVSQTTEGGSQWSSWASFGGVINSDPVPSLNNSGTVEVFARGSDNALWHIAESSPGVADTAGWAGLGGYFTGNPAVQVGGDSGGASVFVRGSDSALWNIEQTADGSWGAWTGLGGYLASDPAVGIDDNATLEVFAEGGDGALWHIRQTISGSWGSWDTLGGILADGVTLGQDLKDSRLEVFALAPDNTLWNIAQVAAGDWK